MALKVIGAGLGRTATFSLKFALEHLGFGPCYHMSEVFAAARRNVPLWLEVVRGKPDWDAVFEGFQSTTDYPACTYWRELAAFYPDASLILTVRDADSWFDSVSETIFSPQMQRSMVGYGYRPARALGWLITAWLVGSIWFQFKGPLEVINADDRLPWNAWLYTIDLVVPIVDFGNKNRWQTPGASQWIASGLIVTGWVLATTVAAGLTRMLKR